MILSSVAPGILLAFVFASTAFASHYAADGWYDRRYGYPPVPSTKAQIVSTFGVSCKEGSNPNVNYNQFMWTAEGVSYQVNFHKKLGGAPIPGWYSGNGGTSTNLYWDVKGTITNNHWTDRVKRGIWGKDCRYIEGTTKVSTHAWGIAIDINSLYEHVGPTHIHAHSVDAAVAGVFQQHGWTWGKVFGDAMHFQYASDSY